MLKAAATALALGAAMTLAACGQDAELRVDKGWVKLAAVPDRPAAAYFTIHGGDKADHLIDVGTDVAIRTEMHETSQAGGMSHMAKIEGGLDVPARARIAFEPGGKHVMLFNVNPGIKPGSKVTLTFTFSSGEQIQYDALAYAAGDTAPMHGDKK